MLHIICMLEYEESFIKKDVAIHFLFKYHRIISYLLYCFGVIGFVCSLVKTYYRLQFFMFGWTHVTLLLITGQRKVHHIFHRFVSSWVKWTVHVDHVTWSMSHLVTLKSQDHPFNLMSVHFNDPLF